ncbi:MAG: hypothetical protein KGK33_03405 [Hyphomicrobiales bacterium]|nr:hypothetical protein [Hyphomicrobiales bacterium]
MNQRLGQKKKGKAKNTANSPTGSTLSTPSIAKPQSQNLLATLKEHPVVVAVSLLLWFLVAAATIVPAAGYVQEKWHETIPAVDFSGDIDQQKPFSIPLAIKNPSGIFAMHNPRISCWTDVDYESQPAKTFSARAVSSQGAISAGLQINPGEVRNYFCDVGGAFNLHEGTSATGPIITDQAGRHAYCCRLRNVAAVDDHSPRPHQIHHVSDHQGIQVGERRLGRRAGNNLAARL